MIGIRNKVAHNNFFVKKDLDNAFALENDLNVIIRGAEKNIDTFKLSIEEQKSIFIATIDTDNEINTNSDSNKFNNKIEVDIDVSERQTPTIITEEGMLELLKQAEHNGRQRDYKFIGLKSFVTRYLPTKGHPSIPTNYSMLNILKEKKLVEIYDHNDETANTVKAIKILVSEN